MQIHTKPIIGESYFTDLPKDKVYLEEKFVPLDKSIVWQLNDLFWKRYTLWEETYNEHFEKSLPTGLSESHDLRFISSCAKRFIIYLKHLDKYNGLPQTLYILEQGPGTGMFAYEFLNFIKKKTPLYYQKIQYILVDLSQEILKTCERLLIDHRHHTQFSELFSFEENNTLFTHRFLYVRHSNMWGQLPCQIMRKRNGKVEELFVQAVLPKTFAKEKINTLFLEQFVTKNPKLWKSFIFNLKLETAWKKENGQSNALDGLLQEEQEMIVSKQIFSNIDFLTGLIDWERDGYIEVVDYIARSHMQLGKRRRIAKFDGAVSYCVNGPSIKNYLHKKGKHATFRKLRKLNTIVTIQKDSFQNFLKSGELVTIAEIAAKRQDAKSFLLEKAHQVFSLQTDMLTFSDMAHAHPDFQSIEKLLGQRIFEELPGSSLLPVFAMRRKRKKDLPTIIRKLKSQNIQNLIVVTGDPSPKGVSNVESGLTSLDGLSVLSKHFFVGAVCSPKVEEIEKTKAKINAGAKFFIVQATFNMKEFTDWAKEIKKQNLHKKAHFIPALIPLTRSTTINAVATFPDIAVTRDMYKKFSNLSEKEVFQEGIRLAKEMLARYNDFHIFSGVYLYTKSPKVLQELLGFLQQ